jgi:3-methylfumaryl-CoA hydratase
MGMVQIELARRSNPGKTPKSFEFRALAPVYAGAAFLVQARHEADGGVTTWIADRNGGLAQQGGVTFQ